MSIHIKKFISKNWKEKLNQKSAKNRSIELTIACIVNEGCGPTDEVPGHNTAFYTNTTCVNPGEIKKRLKIYLLHNIKKM